MGLENMTASLSLLVAELENGGGPIALTRNGKVVAELHPHRPGIAPKRGCLKSVNFYISPGFNDSEFGFADFLPASEIA